MLQPFVNSITAHYATHHRSSARAIRNPTPPTRLGARAATVECLKVPGRGTFGRKGEEGDLLAVHPTVKPMAMVAVMDRLQSEKCAWQRLETPLRIDI
jgi:hypothetical protein